MNKGRNAPAAVVIGSLGGLMAGWALVEEPTGWFKLIVGAALAGLAFREAFL